MFLCIAVPVQEEGYDPEKEELIVPRMPRFYWTNCRNNQGIIKLSDSHFYNDIHVCFWYAVIYTDDEMVV